MSRIKNYTKYNLSCHSLRTSVTLLRELGPIYRNRIDKIQIDKFNDKRLWRNSFQFKRHVGPSTLLHRRFSKVFNWTMDKFPFIFP